MNVTDAILKRKSIRAYLDKPLPADALERIIEAGRWAPNAGPFQISVIRNEDLLKKIDARTHDAMMQSGIPFLIQRASLPGYRPLYGAPVLLLLSGPSDAPFGALNLALAAENMILAATGLGFGTCFIVTPTLALNAESNRELKQEAGIPEDQKVFCAVITGYAAAENKFTAAERVIKGSVHYVD